MTKIVRMKKPNLAVLCEIGRSVRKGKLVVFPTETVYGLGANAFDEKAVRKIFKAKKRPADNPLIVHIANKKQANQLAKKIPKKARILMKRFWPGPLTIVLKKKKIVPRIVTAGLSTVGIRFPLHPVARKLIELAKVPIAAPSANTAGKPSATRAFHADRDLLNCVEWVIDSGPSPIGLESTIIDCTKTIPVLLRPGKISLEQLEKAVGTVQVFSSNKKKIVAKAPGMKYRHYAPKATVELVHSMELVDRVQVSKGKLLVLTLQKKPRTKIPKKVVWKRFASPEMLATELFFWFRKADELGFSKILVDYPSEKGIGRALLNRLQKAAKK
ncbi:MAG: L-threonylcarbamoyladenylate synthase [Candidatus Micrarchaeota archaeon]